MKLLKTILLTAAAVILACCSGPEGFSDREKTIIRQSDSVMYVYSTGKRSDSLLLRLPSQDIPLRALRGEDYRMLAAKMLSTVTSPGQDGVGIAAPQVGINRRVVAVWRSDKDGQPFEVYPNVRIDSLFGDLKKGPEGCLSVPPYRGVVPRWTDAIVSYTDPQTLKSRRDTVHGYTAVIFQHECDHLDGVLYTDRADSVWRNEAWAQERCAFNHPIPVLPDTLRIFAIGNSFSDDGMDRLPEILEEKGIHNVILGRLYIGGCSLERHVHEYEKGGTKYKYYKSAANTWETLSDAASMLDGLCDEPWDVISLQQVSGLSGDYSSFKPWLDSLVHIVRIHATNPSAAIVWHQTWSYAKCSTHPDFPRYHCDQHEMDLAIAACVDSVRRNHGIVTVIPSGPAITRLRESAPADSLDYTRDGFHLNYQEGRRTAAQAWYEAIVEKALPQPEPGKGAQVIAAISKVIWSPALVVLLIFAGLFFSFGTRFVQIRHFKDMLKSLFAVKAGKGKGISSFEAFCMALSGRIGTGNIVGVATAIAIGGAGSVFWMWLIAFFGAATAFMESTLAQKYKFHHETGFRGGPFSYIEAGLGQKWLGVLFALSGVLGYGICLVTVQANGLGTSMSNAFQVPPLYAGIGLAIVLGIVIFGGVKSISRVSSIITPFMALGYIVVALIVICFNIKEVPGVFGQIFRGAFNFGAAGGGIIGTTIMMGVKRGIFSNEAGQGSGAIVSASADVSHPVRQGFAQSFSVYVDTLFVCTATALMILIAAPEGLGTNFAGYTQAAVDTVFPGFGSRFVSIAMVFFVYTTIMAYYFYSESSVIYLMRKRSGSKAEKALIFFLRVALLAAAVVGTIYESTTIWDFGDIAVGVQAWINVVALLLLSRQGFKALKEFEKAGD